MILKEESYYTGLNIKACYFNRHKIYKAATEIINQQQLSEYVEIDAQYLKISLKGTQP